ncbi:uncharacterized protein PSFLO_05060 [Pseudozyma flocculosa]|uniref:Uncharacterized protein n=1 Tax=Pseudozyma flocculosa TaxID=84751 RepID=A0A5C3F845_9BASI|nr:uncharacterized protein PSFLO_05060 [Pseudozyma flocculosa]
MGSTARGATVAAAVDHRRRPAFSMAAGQHRCAGFGGPVPTPASPRLDPWHGSTSPFLGLPCLPLGPGFASLCTPNAAKQLASLPSDGRSCRRIATSSPPDKVNDGGSGSATIVGAAFEICLRPRDPVGRFATDAFGRDLACPTVQPEAKAWPNEPTPHSQVVFDCGQLTMPGRYRGHPCARAFATPRRLRTLSVLCRRQDGDGLSSHAGGSLVFAVANFPRLKLSDRPAPSRRDCNEVALSRRCGLLKASQLNLFSASERGLGALWYLPSAGHATSEPYRGIRHARRWRCYPLAAGFVLHGRSPRTGQDMYGCALPLATCRMVHRSPALGSTHVAFHATPASKPATIDASPRQRIRCGARRDDTGPREPLPTCGPNRLTSKALSAEGHAPPASEQLRAGKSSRLPRNKYHGTKRQRRPF